MFNSAIIVHEMFERTWSWTADHWNRQWQKLYQIEHVFFTRIEGEHESLAQLIDNPASVERLVVLGHQLILADMQAFSGLKELSYQSGPWRDDDEDIANYCAEHNITWMKHRSEGFWGQSVAEFGFALTLCGLRRIPQTHSNITDNLDDWNYSAEKGAAEIRCGQFGDDARFTSGTLAGKRVRIVGAGNIASRYADWCSMFGADVAVWDPFASEPCFHRSYARRVHHLDQLMGDAEIFAPMLPLMKETEGIVTADMIRSLPQGCLVVNVTRAKICDTEVLYQRVLADELALAADVFDVEPVPLDSRLLGRHNVVHTPHNAGRTRQSNEAWADALIDQFI
ncbi:MAG: hydroxyacid dehydrogenase [Planctomycetes bacterium]|nr:hydroxyacid dehydrogenase [Planctomycetota bacterium]